MKFFALKALMFFDFFYKRKILLGLKELLGSNVKIIFDVGAHNGESILLFNRNFNFLKVYTFEPLKTNFFKLKINTKKIADKIVYLNCALGDKKENRIIKKMLETSSSTLNDINEKSIIGFISFAMMVAFGITDLVTGFWGMDLAISDTIYTSFVVVTLGAFGISEAGKAFSKQ